MPTDIRELRKDKGLSQPALAERVQINERTLGRIENGVNSPHRTTRDAIERVLDVHPSDIVYPADLKLALPFPCNIDRYVEARLPLTDPELAAQWAWAKDAWARHPELHRRWQGYVATLRSGGPAHARDFDFGTLCDWLVDQGVRLDTGEAIT